MGAARRRGAALIYAAVTAVAIGCMCMALLFTNLATSKVRVHLRSEQVAFYAAEAGLSDAYMQAISGQIELEPGQAASIGSADAPVAFGKSTYWVDIQPTGTRTWSMISTGNDGRTLARNELIFGEAPTGIFQFAAFGDDGVVLDSNSFIDSYDSALGTYEEQIKSGNDHAKENGDVGSNADIEMSSNSTVWGDATPGPGHAVDTSAPGAFVSGSTDPALEEFELIEIVPPVIASSGAHSGASLTVGPGDWHFDSITMSGGTVLNVVGPCTLIVDDLLLKAGSAIKFDTVGGQVDVYGTGNFVLNSNTEVITDSNTALDVTLLLSANNMDKVPADKIALSSNAEFVGAIYAPKAKVSLGSNFNIYGSVMCGFLDLSSNGEIHYDEALMYDGFGASGEYEALLWRPVALN